MARQPTGRSRGGLSHDAFFKWLLAQPGCAERFIRERLPPSNSSRLSDDPPVLAGSTFIDGALGGHVADLLFAVRLRDGRQMLVYVLLEHKSTAERLTRLQLWRYMGEIWSGWQKGAERGPVPPLIVPIVVYHGASPWPFSEELSELFGEVDPGIADYVPRFRHVLVDLQRIPDDELSADPRLRAGLLVMKTIQWPDLEHRVRGVLIEILVFDRLALATVLVLTASSATPLVCCAQ